MRILDDGSLATPDNVHNHPYVQAVHHKGKFYLFHSKDAFWMKAMDFNYTLKNSVLRFLNQWKKNFTAFTTGNLSPFAVASFAYNQQLSSIVAMIHAPKGATITQTARNALAEGKDVPLPPGCFGFPRSPARPRPLRRHKLWWIVPRRWPAHGR